MRAAMLEMMAVLSLDAFQLEVLADEMTAASNEMADRASARALRDVARRHRVEAIQLRGQYAGLEAQYVERFGEVWKP